MIFSKLIKFVSAGLLASIMFFASALFPAWASPRVTVLAFGLFGAQSVFESEAKGAASMSPTAWALTRSLYAPIQKHVGR